MGLIHISFPFSFPALLSFLELCQVLVHILTHSFPILFSRVICIFFFFYIRRCISTKKKKEEKKTNHVWVFPASSVVVDERLFIWCLYCTLPLIRYVFNLLLSLRFCSHESHLCPFFCSASQQLYFPLCGHVDCCYCFFFFCAKVHGAYLGSIQLHVIR